MIDQAAYTWNLNSNQFFLHGFSGGAQFVHPFLYLHPERLLDVSIGAPGRITPPNTSAEWPHGLANIPSLFNLPPNSPNWTAINNVPVQLVVGENDIDESTMQMMSNPNYAEVEAGNTRVGRVHWLYRALSKLGHPSVILTEIPGVGHDGGKCITGS